MSDPIQLPLRTTVPSKNTLKPPLSMVWSVDPDTGKLEARWVAEWTDLKLGKFFAPAA